MQRITTGILLFFMAVTSCKKDNTTPNSIAMVKTEYRSSADVTYNYTYDEQGRITSYTLAYGKVKFTYSDNEVVQTFYNDNNEQTAVQTYTLNDEGLADKLVAVQQGYNTTEIYKYANGLRTEIKRYLGGGLDVIYDIVYENGNMLSSKMRAQPFNEVNSETYYSYTDKLNTVGNENKGFGFKGKSSKNLESRSVSLNILGDTMSIYSSTYLFDDAGRVKTHLEYKNGILRDSVSYTYY